MKRWRARAKTGSNACPTVKPRKRRAMSVVEVLISLAISAMLLTAVAAAFTASGSAIENNDQFFRATQAARVSMNQVLTDIRRAHAVAVASGNQVNLITFDQHDRSYKYDSTNKAIKLIMNDVAGTPQYTVASNVTSCVFAADTYTDAQQITHTARVSVSIVVQVGNNTIRLSGSAAPRRERTYD